MLLTSDISPSMERDEARELILSVTNHGRKCERVNPQPISRIGS
jgi:hypothetical protein